MTINRRHVTGAIALLLPLLALGGCYTQFGSTADESTLDDAYLEEETGGVSDGSYYDARERFYADAYYPGYTLGAGFAAYEWGWGYPYTPYSSGYAYGGGHGASGHGNVRPQGTVLMRRFGSGRTVGTSRPPASTMVPAPPGYAPLPVGVRNAGNSPSPGVAPARPGFTGGRRGTEERRPTPVAVPVTRGQADQAGAKGTARPVYIPPAEKPRDGGSSGSGGTADRPAERPAPAPAQPAPSGGSRGNDSRGTRP